MKRIITIAAASLALAGAASAMTNPSGSASEIKNFAPGVEVSQLSDHTVRQLLSAIHGGDTESEKQLQVRAILMNAK